MFNPIKKIKAFRKNIKLNIQKAKYFIIVLSALQILTFIMVVILLILFIAKL